jgi:hypothetical protein
MIEPGKVGADGRDAGLRVFGTVAAEAREDVERGPPVHSRLGGLAKQLIRVREAVVSAGEIGGLAKGGLAGTA